LWEIRFGKYRYSLNGYEEIGWYMYGDNCRFPLIDIIKDEIIGNIHDNPELLGQ
jgi:hypothetical protein